MAHTEDRSIRLSSTHRRPRAEGKWAERGGGEAEYLPVPRARRCHSPSPWRRRRPRTGRGGTADRYVGVPATFLRASSRFFFFFFRRRRCAIASAEDGPVGVPTAQRDPRHRSRGRGRRRETADGGPDGPIGVPTAECDFSCHRRLQQKVSRIPSVLRAAIQGSWLALCC